MKIGEKVVQTSRVRNHKNGIKMCCVRYQVKVIIAHRHSIGKTLSLGCQSSISNSKRRNVFLILMNCD
jgi:hypothetical protein